MLKVLIVDDSATVRQLLTAIMQEDSGIEVVASLPSGTEALRFLEKATEKPDIITMDVCMPGLNGLEATTKIMETTPVPILIVTGHESSLNVERVFTFMQAGAVGVVAKPPGPADPAFEFCARQLVRTLKSLSEIKLVKRRSLATRNTAPVAPKPEKRVIRCIGIGASTGGPQVLKEIIQHLPADFSIPILIAQHISQGFTEGLAKWLSDENHTVMLGYDGAPIKPRMIYVAPDNMHMGVTVHKTLILIDSPKEYGMRPAVSALFRSMAKVYKDEGVAVLLTGMGKDGAQEMKLMKEAGALTIAQDKATSVVHGMPGAAIDIGAATHVMSPEAIVEYLVSLDSSARASNLTNS